MAQTNRTSIEAGVNTYYDKKFLRQMLYELRLAQFAQKRPLPKNMGDSVDFFKYHEVELTLTAGVVDSLLSESVDETPTTITGRTINAAIDEYGQFSKHSKMVKLAHIDRNLAGVSKLWGTKAARLFDFLCWQKVVSEAATPVRADLDATLQIDGLVLDSVTTGALDPSVTSIWITLPGAGFGSAADHLNQSVIVFTAGKAKGTARPVNDYTIDGGNSVANIIIDSASPLDVVPDVGDEFRVVSPHAMTAGTDDMNTLAINRGVRIVRDNGTTPFEGGYFAGILSPEAEESLKNDSSWENLHTYKDSLGANGMFTGEIGKYLGVRWIRANQIFRFPTYALGTDTEAGGVGTNGANYHPSYILSGSEDAVISTSLILGQEAFGVTQFENEAGGMRPGIIIKTPGSQTVSQPLNRNSTVGYWMAMVAKGLNPMFGVQVWTAENAA